jgi:hypothetical protein
VRRPLIARPETRQRASTLIAAAAALGVVGGLVRAAAGSGVAEPRSIADGVRRLRAAVVGDVTAGDRAAERARMAPGAAAAGTPSVGTDGRRTRDGAGHQLARGSGPAFTPGVPWWADSAHWGAEVVRWSDDTREPLVVAAGDTVMLAAPELPVALPEALRRRGVRWHVDGAASLLAGAPGVVPAGAARLVARTPGEASVVAFSPAGRTMIPVRVRAAVRGRVFAVGDDGELGVVAARIVVSRRGAAAADTAHTDAAGRFRLALPEGWAGETDVHVEPLDASHDAITLAGVAADRLHTLGVVLSPSRWTIAAGAYAGTVLPVRAGAARGFWRAAPGGRPVGWADDATRTIALDPYVVAAVDTGAFWSAARMLGHTWGRPLFRPARDGEVPDITVGLTPGLSVAGMTTLSYDGSGVVGGARIEFRSATTAADPRVAAHELLHALGFGHARGWASLVGLTGYAGPTVATAADVAHGQLLEVIRRASRQAEREYGATFGWAGGRP